MSRSYPQHFLAFDISLGLAQILADRVLSGLPASPVDISLDLRSTGSQIQLRRSWQYQQQVQYCSSGSRDLTEVFQFEFEQNYFIFSQSTRRKPGEEDLLSPFLCHRLLLVMFMFVFKSSFPFNRMYFHTAFLVAMNQRVLLRELPTPPSVAKTFFGTSRT